jgi:hypothetical protein
MIDPSIRKEILGQLDQLGSDQQRRVLDFARSLATNTSRRVPGKDLLSFVGAISDDDLRMMTQAIEEGCERVNLNEW